MTTADPSLANGSPLVLVRLESGGAPRVSPQALRERYGLSPRQAEVAALPALVLGPDLTPPPGAWA